MPDSQHADDRDALGGVPVVDLTASTNALLERAEWLRVEALNLITTAVTMRQHAEQLEELVATLQGPGHTTSGVRRG